MCEQQDKTSREPRTTESQTYLFATQSYVQRDNHSAMTHPLKLDCHQSQDPTHCIQQRWDTLPMDCWAAYNWLWRIDIILMEETWEHVSLHWQQG